VPVDPVAVRRIDGLRSRRVFVGRRGLLVEEGIPSHKRHSDVEFLDEARGGDSEIIRFVRGWRGHKSDITVVSDDNNVRNNCRAHGATVQPSSFILTPKTRASPRKSNASADGKGLDPKSAADIDEELRKKFGL